jgi:hypothetical protein
VEACTTPLHESTGCLQSPLSHFAGAINMENFTRPFSYLESADQPLSMWYHFVSGNVLDEVDRRFKMMKMMNLPQVRRSAGSWKRSGTRMSGAGGEVRIARDPRAG